MQKFKVKHTWSDIFGPEFRFCKTTSFLNRNINENVSKLFFLKFQINRLFRLKYSPEMSVTQTLQNCATKSQKVQVICLFSLSKLSETERGKH